MVTYRFVSRWQFQAPIEPVWAALVAIERYPEWWNCVPACEKLTKEETRVGTQFLETFRARLPYTLRVTTTITEMAAPHQFTFETTGDLVGQGTILLTRQGDSTHVEFPWDCHTTGFWMNLCAPLLRWLFVWNHDWMMAQGQQGLAQWLKKKGY
jgi:hypothetical protein